jgi:hypothetical protein
MDKFMEILSDYERELIDLSEFLNRVEDINYQLEEESARLQNILQNLFHIVGKTILLETEDFGICEEILDFCIEDLIVRGWAAENISGIYYLKFFKDGEMSEVPVIKLEEKNGQNN